MHSGFEDEVEFKYKWLIAFREEVHSWRLHFDLNPSGRGSTSLFKFYEHESFKNESVAMEIAMEELTLRLSCDPEFKHELRKGSWSTIVVQKLIAERKAEINVLIDGETVLRKVVEKEIHWKKLSIFTGSNPDGGTFFRNFRFDSEPSKITV